MLANHDSQMLNQAFQTDRRVRIEEFLEADAANKLRLEIGASVDFQYACHLDGENVRLTEAELKAMSAGERTELNNRLMADAARGIGFFYGSKTLQSAGEAQAVLLADTLFDFVNSKPVLSLIREISGDADIASADAQLTRYGAGNYLTRHVDDITGDNRRLAYVLSLTERWHPDWGGLLQFYERSGEPRDAWAPGRNHLSLFDVSHVHSVTYVTPFAAAPRYSLTGWFRTAAQ